MALVSRRVLVAADFQVPDTTDLGDFWDSGYTTHSSLKIVGGRVRPSVDATDCAESVNTPSFPADQWVEIPLTTFTTNSAHAFILLRATAPATETFYLCIAFNQGEGGITQVYQVIAGVGNLILNDATNIWAQGDRFRGEMQGTRIDFYKSDRAMLNVTDGGIASGRTGFGGNANVATELEIESFSAGDFVNTGPMGSRTRPAPFKPGLAR